MIHGPPEAMHFSVDLHEDLVQVPLPMDPGPHAIDPLPPDCSRPHRAKPVAPKRDGFMADVNATLMQGIFDVPQRQWKPNIQHQRLPNDLWRRFEGTKWAMLFHAGRLFRCPARFNQVSSGTTGGVVQPAPRFLPVGVSASDNCIAEATRPVINWTLCQRASSSKSKVGV